MAENWQLSQSLLIIHKTQTSLQQKRQTGKDKRTKIQSRERPTRMFYKIAKSMLFQPQIGRNFKFVENRLSWHPTLDRKQFGFDQNDQCPGRLDLALTNTKRYH
jgi:hypothetical protein